MESNLFFDETEVQLKRCPRCEESLPLSEFGVCRARKDGLNLYCKLCIRQKIALSRKALREYKKARGKYGHAKSLDKKAFPSARRIARMLRTLSPEDRVREAIKGGAYTQKEIASVTKLPRDEVTDCIATLLLWSRGIRTRVIRHQRMYFINESPGMIMREPVRSREEPRSYGVSTIYGTGDPDIGKGMSTRYLRNKVG